MTGDTLLQHPHARVAAACPDVVPATLGRRLAAWAGEALLALAPLLVVPLLALVGVGTGWAWTLGGVGVVAVAAALFGDLTGTGQTAIRRLLGLRTVSAAAQLPPAASELFGRRVVTADLRAAADPLLILPTAAGTRAPQPLGSEPRPAWRPPVAAASGTWRLQLDDGGVVPVTGPTLVGRDPSHPEGGADHALLAIPDLSRSISRVHALVEPSDDCLWLTDIGATNGTRAASPSASGGTVIERWLRPGERAAVRSGGTIHLGDRVLRVTRS